MTANDVPRLARGCRLMQDLEQSWVLLIPEGVLRLSGPGHEILHRCDGAHNFAQIVSELNDVFKSPDTGAVETETLAFLQRLVDRGVVVLN